MTNKQGQGRFWALSESKMDVILKQNKTRETCEEENAHWKVAVAVVAAVALQPPT